jgi:hypothetical protein
MPNSTLGLQQLNEVTVSSLINATFEDINQIPSVEAAAQLLNQKLCETFKTGEKSDLVLSRTFHSFEYQALPDDIQKAAQQAVNGVPSDKSFFLTLLGTYGDESAWRHRSRSQAHQALPLTRSSIKKIPMMSRLFQQIGLDLGLLLGEGSPGITVSGVEKSYGIFYVKEAQGSPYIPAQDFVKAYHIKSVLGTGVKLPTNDIGIYIGFSRVELDETTASHISPLMSLFWQRAFPLVEKGYFS